MKKISCTQRLSVFGLFLILFSSTFAQKQLPTVKASHILTSVKTLAPNYKDTVISMDVMSNVDYTVTTSESWIKQISRLDEPNSNTLHFRVSMNMNSTERSADVVVQNAAKSVSKTIKVTQSRDNSAEYIKGDQKVKVSGATASSYQSGGDISLSYDGDYSTMYHSNWTNTDPGYFPITLTYNFSNVDQIDYLVYHPRQQGNNGLFKEVVVQYKLKGDVNYATYDTFNFGGVNSASRVSFTNPLINPVSIRLVVNSGAGDGVGFASCAEMEFYKATSAADPAYSIFADKLMTTLKSGVTQEQVDTISNLFVRGLATEILSGDYSLDYRVADYRAYKNPVTLGTELHIGDGYSKYENITGIFLPKGKHVVVVENLAPGKQLSLRIPRLSNPDSWGMELKSFPLFNGVNVINNTSWDGLGYIYYYSEDPDKENVVKIHFPRAAVNGYFDITKHNDADFNRLVDNAIAPILDCRGRNIQVMYPVSAFKQYTYGRGVELISNYDSLVTRQHRIIGLEKYHKVPDNRILARVNYAYYMFRDGDGVAYKEDAMWVADPDVVTNGDPCWGFSHEAGHVHQLRPYFNWTGLGEVSNNVMSLYCTTSFGNESRLKGTYAGARTEIINGGISYLQSEDVFKRLVPFWQLHLFFSRKGGNPNFYPDLFEALRNLETVEPSWKTGTYNISDYQLNFVKQACIVSHTDLTDFFDKWGFFKVGTFYVGDYSSQTYLLTQARVDAFKAEIAAMELPKPIDKTTGLEYDITLIED